MDLPLQPPVAPMLARLARRPADRPALRHPARLVRWRPDRDAASCTFGQLVVADPAEVARLAPAREG